MTVEAVVVDLTGTVNSPGTQVTLTWSSASDLTLIYTANGTLAQPDSGVSQLEIQALAGAQGGGSGNGNGSPPSYGKGGVGSSYIDAFFSPSALTYPVAVTVGQGGAGDDTNEGTSGEPGTDTLLGNSYPTDYYVHVFGGDTDAASPTASGDSSSTKETAPSPGDSPNSIYAGAAGGGGDTFGGVNTNWAPGVATGGGPGGDGGICSGAGIGQDGLLYGGGAGAGVWTTGHVAYGGGTGAPGVLIAIETYESADYYNVYRQGAQLATNVSSLSFVDNNPITGTITYEIISVISGVEQPQGAGYVTVTVTQPPISVPNLIGLTSEAASAAIVDAGLVVSGTGVQVLDNGPYFVVVAQGPAAGTLVPVNTSVGYVIAVPTNWGGIGWDGQLVTYSGNVTAPAGIYGDQWGANGGGEEPIGGGVIGQTGWSDSVKVTISDAQRREAYLIGTPNLSVGSQMSDTQLDGHTPDNTLPIDGSLI